MHKVKDIAGKRFRIPRLVQNRLPHNHTGTVAVAAHHVPHIAVYALFENRLLVPELPPRGVHNHKQSQLVTSIHKGRVLRIVGVADNLHAGRLEFYGIAPVQVVREGIADNGIVLMAVAADEFTRVGPPVQDKSLLRIEGNRTDTDPLHHPVYGHTPVVRYPYVEPIEVRRFGRPQSRCLDGQFCVEGTVAADRNGVALFAGGSNRAVGCHQRIFHTS